MKIEKVFEDAIKSLVDKTLNHLDVNNKEFYAMWVAQTYYYAKYTTTILALGGVKSQDMVLKGRYFKHVGEEANHELLAIKDIEGLGYEITDLPELMETKNLYQTQYFQIQEYGSQSLLGWVLALEGYAINICEPIYESARKIYGEKACRFLKIHAQEDPEHFKSALKQIDLIPDNHDLIINMLDTIKRYELILDAIACHCHQNSKIAA